MSETPGNNADKKPSIGLGWPWEKSKETIPSALRETQSLPRITIITPSFNQGPFIEETIRSVLLQDYPNLEYIIMDAGSSDATVEIIKRYSDRISYWESQRDRGQSHAINKGISRSTGQIFNWINSDDLLMPGALWAVAAAWLEKPDHIVSGQTEFFDETGTLDLMKASGQTLVNFVRFWEAKDWGWAQPGTFVPLAALKEIGGIEERLKYCMDYHMMVRLLMHDVPVVALDQPLARFRLHETSKTIGSRAQFRLERVPMLRSIENIPVAVAPSEWDREQARRLVHVAWGSARGGRFFQGCQLLTRSLLTSPLGAIQEIMNRCGTKLSGS